MLKIKPLPWRFITGKAARQPQTTPSRLMPTIQFQSSTGVASTAPATATPALFTSTSRPSLACGEARDGRRDELVLGDVAGIGGDVGRARRARN